MICALYFNTLEVGLTLKVMCLSPLIHVVNKIFPRKNIQSIYGSKKMGGQSMRQYLVTAALLLLSVIVLAACGDKNDEVEKSEERAIPVEVTEVEKGDFTVKKSVYGRTQPSKQTPIMVEQPGEISTLKVENGDEVNKDNHLATITTAMGSQTINAPVSGTVAKLNVQEKAFQSNEDPLMVIIDADKIHAAFQVTEGVRSLYKKGDKATVYIDDEKYEGKVLAIDSLPDDSGQYPLHIEIDNKDKEILPGVAIKLEATDKKVKDTLIVPTDAIVSETDGKFVFLADGDKAKKVEVEIKETQSEKSAITGDLKKGDQVIVKGQFTLADESKIEVKEGKEE